MSNAWYFRVSSHYSWLVYIRHLHSDVVSADTNAIALFPSFDCQLVSVVPVGVGGFFEVGDGAEIEAPTVKVKSSLSAPVTANSMPSLSGSVAV